MPPRKKQTPEERKERKRLKDAIYYEKKLIGSFENKIISLLYTAKCRAKKSGVEFSITEKDFAPVTHCPLLGVRLNFSIRKRGSHYNSPTIDRIDSNLGYVPGNVWVISGKANRIKNNATLREFETIYRNWKKFEEQRNAKREEQLCVFADPA
jgi:hypothetical protein